jgi:hypothetical protein
MPPRISASRTASARDDDKVELVGTASVGMTLEPYHRAVHRLDQCRELREPLLGRAADGALFRAKEDFHGQGLLEIAPMQSALTDQRGVLLRDEALARREQLLQRAGVRARLRGALVGIAPRALLFMKPVAEPAAECCTYHEAERTARERADRGPAADADGLFLRGDARLVLDGTIPRPRMARRREQRTDQRYDDFPGKGLVLHGSLLKRNVVNTAPLQRTALTCR